jgi:hypothetical protein
LSQRSLPISYRFCLFLLVTLSTGCLDLQTSDIRRAAQRVSSRNNIQQLLLALRNFHDEQQQWPDHLIELVPLLDGNTSILSNPITGDDPGYAYVKPALHPSDPKAKNTIVIYQLRRGKRDMKLEVGYLDGSVRQLAAKNLTTQDIRQ